MAGYSGKPRGQKLDIRTVRRATRGRPKSPIPPPWDDVVKRSVGDLLIWAGAAVGAGGGVLLAMGAWVHLPTAVVIVIAKALPFVVAAALLTIGAVVRRSALRAWSVQPSALLREGEPPVGDAVPRASARSEVRR
ncbi:MAG: hypothetical protein ACXW65_20650 [Gemmatirosa sp.]